MRCSGMFTFLATQAIVFIALFIYMDDWMSIQDVSNFQLVVADWVVFGNNRSFRFSTFIPL